MRGNSLTASRVDSFAHMGDPSIPEETPARTIDDVIARLDEIIDWSRGKNSRLGYFPALYRKVTLAVKEGIGIGIFEDGERMERLDVVFANRYLEAFAAHRASREPTKSWLVAFQTSERWWPIVLQHPLLGINAHINLDLGVAAARVSPGASIHQLKNDFNSINRILGSLVDGVKAELQAIWPALRLIDWVGGRAEDAIINFSLEKAREFAWDTAQRLAPLPSSQQETMIRELDRDVSLLSNIVPRPGPVLVTLTKIIRLGERGSVPEIIDILR